MLKEPGLWTKRRELLALAAMVAIYFLSFFQRTAIPGTVFNQVQSDLHLSASGVTALGAMFLYIYATAQIFVGLAADRFGGGRVLVGGGLLMAVGAVVFPLSHTTGMLYASRAITGLGASFMFLSAVQETNALFGPRLFPLLIGPVLFGGYCGGLAATSPFNWAATRYGWRPALLAVGAASFVCVGLTWLLLRRLNHPVPQERRLSLRPLLEILRSRRNWPLLVCGFVNYPVYFVFQSTLGKKFLEDVTGMGAASAARYLFVMMAVSAVLTFFGGVFLRLTRERRRPLLIVMPALLLVAILGMRHGVLHGAPPWFFLLGYVLLAASSALSPVAIATITEMNSPDSVALSVASLNCCTYLGVAALANLGGAVLDRFSEAARATAAGTIYPPSAYAVLLLILAVPPVVSLVCSCMVPETRGRSLYKDPGAPVIVGSRPTPAR